jgi:hypothetical protein
MGTETHLRRLRPVSLEGGSLIAASRLTKVARAQRIITRRFSSRNEVRVLDPILHGHASPHRAAAFRDASIKPKDFIHRVPPCGSIALELSRGRSPCRVRKTRDPIATTVARSPTAGASAYDSFRLDLAPSLRISRLVVSGAARLVPDPAHDPRRRDDQPIKYASERSAVITFSTPRVFAA